MSNIPIEVNTGETKTITFHTAGTFNTEDIVFSISSAGDDANTTMSGIAYCETTGSTAAKTATMPGFELVTGQRIFLQTTKKNTATSDVTLSVNGTEAKPIKIGTADVTSSNLTAGWWVANYDGTNWVLTSIKLTDSNTDTKVTQSSSTAENYRKILLSYNSYTETGADITSATNVAYQAVDVEVQPSSGTILANRFVKNGGTNLEFLKADGSVDDNTYSLSSHDHSGVYKPIQTAVSDPTASTTTSTTFIDTINQDTNGVITATKKTLPTASTSTEGIIKIGTTASTAAAGNHTHSGYKTTQTAISDPTASSDTSNTFIDTISQDTNGVITATKKTLPTASDTVAGMTTVGASGGAATYDHTHSDYVDLDSDQTISGVKTFSTGFNMNTGSSWTNSDRTIPFGASGNATRIQYVSNSSTKGLTFNPSTGELKAASFIKRGGSGSEFLKADGTVDPNTYSVSTHNHDDSYSPLNHVHAFSDLSSTPTTISGYGITDAKIDGNDVILGSNTLTVLTSSSSLDATKLTGTVPTSSYIDTDYVFVCSTAASTAAKTATSKTTYELVAKRYYYVYISNSNTKDRALTFNPNSSGAKPIYIDGVASGENNYTLPKGLYHVYYDGTNWYFNPDGSISCSGVRVADNTGFLKADGSIDNSNYITANNLVTINNQSLIGTGNITIQGGGSGGTSDYTQLSNLPSINGTTLTGNVNLATPEQLASKQATLVSGTNIKTINGESILGSGDICPESITIDDTTYTIDTLTGNKIYTFTNPLTSLTIVAYGDTSLETILYFTTGTGFMFSVPNGTRYIIESPIFNEGMSYVVSIKDGTIVMGEIE